MSDDANNFYNAWENVFTVTDTKKLICTQHVDKSWRKGLQQHITDTTKQADVYHHLHFLLAERGHLILAKISTIYFMTGQMSR